MLLATNFAAKRVRVSGSTIRRYARNGVLSVAKYGSRREMFFDTVALDAWSIWFQKTVIDRRTWRARQSTLAKVNGQFVPGTLSCEVQDETDRERLFVLVKSKDKSQARSALTELYYRYNKLRLPLEERRVGIDLGDVNG